MLTYSDLQKIYRTEKKTPSLQYIEDSFYSDLEELLSQSTDEDRQHLMKLAEEIYRRRRNKIIMHAFRSESIDSPPENITSVEREMYNSMIRLIEKFEGIVFSGMGEKADTEKKMSQKAVEEAVEDAKKREPKKTKVKILGTLPAIVGSDSKHYGPFKKDDIVDLPAKNAKIMVENGMAEKV